METEPFPFLDNEASLDSDGERGSLSGPDSTGSLKDFLIDSAAESDIDCPIIKKKRKLDSSISTVAAVLL